jgi:hypothetical protein
MDRRSNWKSEISEEVKMRARTRQGLIVEKDAISREIHSLTMEEVRSDRYVQLKCRQAEIMAKLATL